MAAAAYLVCPIVSGPIAVAIAAGIVAFAVDSMNPALWALGQDIGGDHVGAAIAWNNMWGNFGASAVSKLIPLILAASFHACDWHEIFWICASGFALVSVSICFVDSTRGLDGAALTDFDRG